MPSSATRPAGPSTSSRPRPWPRTSGPSSTRRPRLLSSELRIFTYDGDTPQDARRAIRAQGHIVLTNPDMLHAGILPHHTKWIKLFENLKYIVIDELHNYRGIFGSHLANILRRLKRVAAFYGSNPQFILCTATIANPEGDGREDDRGPGDAGRRQRRPAGREALRLLHAAHRQRGPGHPALLRQRVPAHRGDLPPARPPDHRLRPEPPHHRGPPDLSQAGHREDHQGRGAHPRLPGRLPAPGPAGDREGPPRREDPRRRLDERPRARHRHRDARRRRARRLPGHHRLDLAEGRAGRPQDGPLGGGPRRLELAPRPVHRPPPRVLLHEPAGERPHQPGQPVHHGQPRRVRRLRAALPGGGEVRDRWRSARS